MPEFSFDLIKEDFKDNRSITPPRFGYAFKTEITNANSGQWIDVKQSRIWSLTIKSEAALSINLIFNDFYLTEGAEFYIYNEKRDTKFGPVLPEHNTSKRKLATDIFKGSAVTLILFEPVSSKNKSTISISYVIHGYSDACGFNHAELDCHINASCPLADSLVKEKKAVAKILIYNGQSCCSGVLLNNACYDYKPYVLTGFHVLDFNNNRSLDPSEIADLDTWTFKFRYISPTCENSSSPLIYLEKPPKKISLSRSKLTRSRRTNLTTFSRSKMTR